MSRPESPGIQRLSRPTTNAPTEPQAAAAAENLGASVASWIHYLRTVRNYSPHTLAAYRRDLLAALPADAHLDAVTNADIRMHLGDLRRRGLAARSIQRKLSALRAFFGWMRRQGLVESDPTAGVRAPRGDKRLPRAPDPDHTGALLDQPHADTPLALRNQAVLEVLYSCGLRLSELVGLDVDAFDERRGRVRVLGKGRKTRIVPVGRPALTAVQRWLAVRSLLKPQDGALFISRLGRRLSPRSVQKLVRAAGAQTGLPDLHPHQLRHAFASHLLESSGELRAVQELLGHADLSSTQIYTHLDFQHLAKVYDAAHPRARARRRSPADDDSAPAPGGDPGPTRRSGS